MESSRRYYGERKVRKAQDQRRIDNQIKTFVSIIISAYFLYAAYYEVVPMYKEHTIAISALMLLLGTSKSKIQKIIICILALVIFIPVILANSSFSFY